MRFEFGEFCVDDSTRQLVRQRAHVHLSPKAFDLLLTLIRERPRALTKADLHARLWPKTFVSDASLAMLIADIRAALGETARTARSVRTVHRHGYAFQAEATEGAAAPAAARCWIVTEERQIALQPGDNVVGRDPHARVWLDSPSVSRRHACIRVDDDRATVEDLRSKNGTHANDARVTSITTLRDGDGLRFGSVTAAFRVLSIDPTRTEAGSS